MSEPVVARVFSSPFEAEAALALVEASGFEAVLDIAHAARIRPVILWGAGGVRLIVSTDDLDSFVQLLDEHGFTG